MDISVTDANTVSLSLSPSKPASKETTAERILSGKAATTSQPAPAKGKGKGAATYAPGTGKRSDLTFLDPMNKADCPPKAIALAAGELVLRIREEKRRREVGGIAADPPLPSKRMCGGKPGRQTKCHLLTCVLFEEVACCRHIKRHILAPVLLAEASLGSCLCMTSRHVLHPCFACFIEMVWKWCRGHVFSFCTSCAWTFVADHLLCLLACSQRER